jgi:hypothetical protein
MMRGAACTEGEQYGHWSTGCGKRARGGGNKHCLRLPRRSCVPASGRAEPLSGRFRAHAPRAERRPRGERLRAHHRQAGRLPRHIGARRHQSHHRARHGVYGFHPARRPYRPGAQRPYRPRRLPGGRYHGRGRAFLQAQLPCQGSGFAAARAARSFLHSLQRAPRPGAHRPACRCAAGAYRFRLPQGREYPWLQTEPAGARPANKAPCLRDGRGLEARHLRGRRHFRIGRARAAQGPCRAVRHTGGDDADGHRRAALGASTQFRHARALRRSERQPRREGIGPADNSRRARRRPRGGKRGPDSGAHLHRAYRRRPRRDRQKYPRRYPDSRRRGSGARGHIGARRALRLRRMDRLSFRPAREKLPGPPCAPGLARSARFCR